MAQVNHSGTLQQPFPGWRRRLIQKRGEADEILDEFEAGLTEITAAFR